MFGGFEIFHIDKDVIDIAAPKHIVYIIHIQQGTDCNLRLFTRIFEGSASQWRVLNIFCEGMVIVMVINGECVFVNSIVRLHTVLKLK